VAARFSAISNFQVINRSYLMGNKNINIALPLRVK